MIFIIKVYYKNIVCIFNHSVEVQNTGTIKY